MSYQRLINQDDEYELEVRRKSAKNRKISTRNGGANSSSSSEHSPGANSDSPYHIDKVDFLYHDVTLEDTLQGISLRYNCTVDKLRYYNHFMSDLEFRARKVIKIPVPEHSVRLGQLIDIEPEVSKHPDTEPKIINIGISAYLAAQGSTSSGNGAFGEIKQYLDHLGKNIDDIQRSLPSGGFGDSEDVSMLGRPVISPENKLGINWFYLWVAILLLLTPIVYGTYVVIHIDHYTHPSTDTYHSRAIKYVHGAFKHLISVSPKPKIQPQIKSPLETRISSESPLETRISSESPPRSPESPAQESLPKPPESPKLSPVTEVSGLQQPPEVLKALPITEPPRQPEVAQKPPVEPPRQPEVAKKLPVELNEGSPEVPENSQELPLPEMA